jgi:hypothetical protein
MVFISSPYFVQPPTTLGNLSLRPSFYVFDDVPRVSDTIYTICNGGMSRVCSLGGRDYAIPTSFDPLAMRPMAVKFACCQISAPQLHWKEPRPGSTRLFFVVKRGLMFQSGCWTPVILDAQLQRGGVRPRFGIYGCARTDDGRYAVPGASIIPTFWAIEIQEQTGDQ